MDTLFSKTDLIKTGWQRTKEHFWFLFLLLVAVFVVSAASGGFPPLAIVVGIFVSISVITVSLMLADGMSPSWKDPFAKYAHYRVFVNYLLASLINMALVGVGLLLLVVPGIYIALRIQFYKFLIVDKEDVGPWMAVKESWKMTKGHTWNLFLFTLLIILINFVGFLALGIGLIVTFPVSIIAYASLYRKLLQNVSLAVPKPQGMV